jgi:phosphate starvation-inducible membrane PsiE
MLLLMLNLFVLCMITMIVKWFRVGVDMKIRYRITISDHTIP